MPAVSTREYRSNLVDSVAGLRGLSVLFIGANIFGQGVGATIDGQMLVNAASHVGIAGALWIPFLLGVIAIGSLFGLHAVILIVVIGHTLPPATIGLAPATLALIMLTSWGVGGVLSPLSNLTSDTIILSVNPKDKRAGGGICSGDSGGPAFLDGVIVGVTSWGTSQFCRSGQSGFQRLDDADARGFWEPLLAVAAGRL